MSAKQPVAPNGTKPTPAAKWREGREKGVLFHFPSGMEATVRPINVGAFIQMGQIPDFLSPMVAKLINGGSDIAKETEDWQKVAQIYDIFCKCAFLSPRVVAEITDPETDILAEDISDIDKQTLFSFMGQPASTLASFRPLPQDLVDDLVGKPSDTPVAE